MVRNGAIWRRRTVSYQTYGPDSDGDGIPDIAEPLLGTDPDNADSDGDGQNDLADAKPTLADNAIQKSRATVGFTMSGLLVENNVDAEGADVPDHLEFYEGQFAVAAAETADLRSRGLMAWILTADGQIGMTIGSAADFPLPSTLPLEGQILDGSLPDQTAVRLLPSPLTEGSLGLGTIILAIPLRDSQTVMRQILLGLALSIPVVLGLSAVGGLLLAGRALQPVADISHTAQQINAADLSQRLDLDLPDDEIGELAHTFNEMLARLEGAFQRERQLTSDVSHELRTPLGMLKTQSNAAEQGLNLQLEIPPNVDFTLLGDAARLRQVFSNLVEDGVKHTAAGGQVTVKADESRASQIVPIVDEVNRPIKAVIFEVTTMGLWLLLTSEE